MAKTFVLTNGFCTESILPEELTAQKKKKNKKTKPSWTGMNPIRTERR